MATQGEQGDVAPGMITLKSIYMISFQDDSVIRIQMEVDNLNPQLFIVLHKTGLGYGTDYLVMSFIDTWEVEEDGKDSMVIFSFHLQGVLESHEGYTPDRIL